MNIRKAIIGGSLVASTMLGGAIGASLINGTASAATTATTTPAATASAPDNANFPAHGSADHESAEKAVTGDNATKAKDAAVKSVGSGTAGDVTSDFDGSGYEVTVTKADGTQVEVHLDSAFNVMQGHGGGDHGGRGGNDNDADDTATSSTTAQ